MFWLKKHQLISKYIPHKSKTLKRTPPEFQLLSLALKAVKGLRRRVGVLQTWARCLRGVTALNWPSRGEAGLPWVVQAWGGCSRHNCDDTEFQGKLTPGRRALSVEKYIVEVV